MKPPHSRCIVAAHQPNFFPWLGWFDKLFKADIFIILDDVQFPRGRSGCWGNRVRIAQEGRARWLTVPVSRAYHGLREYREMLLEPSCDRRGRLVHTLKAAYAGTPFFESIFPLVRPLVENPAENLVSYNMAAIEILRDLLGLAPGKFVLASALKVSTSATRRLIDLTIAVGGDTYLCGGGAEGYQNDMEFPRHGVKLLYQDFKPLEYKQAKNPGSFIPGLTVLDALFNIGPKATQNLFQPPILQGMDGGST